MVRRLSLIVLIFIFFFKQKTAYEMRISDWSSDVCSSDLLDALSVRREDFLEAHKRVQPSAMREIMIQMPTVRWDDIGGVDEARDRLREGVELPLKDPDAFRRLGIRPAKGFLLFGPPGTGKTLLAKAVARESEANFIAVKSDRKSTRLNSSH